MINQDNLKTFADNWANDLGKKCLRNPDILNVDVINQSIEMILTTLRGSRLFNLRFGSRLPIAIFDNMDEGTMEGLLNEIIQDIKNWEDRILILERDVRLNVELDTNTVTLTIPYIIRERRSFGVFKKVITK